MQTYTLSQRAGEGRLNKSSVAYFWVISLLFWEVVKTGSITRELRESNRVVANHSRREVFSKRSTEGEGMNLASRLQKVKTKTAYKTALEESSKLGTDYSEMKIVINCSQRRMVSHPLPKCFFLCFF